jgi:hypothetical protein
MRQVHPETLPKNSNFSSTRTLVDFFSNKNETMFGSGYENYPEFGVLGGVIFKLDIWDHLLSPAILSLWYSRFEVT